MKIVCECVHCARCAHLWMLKEHDCNSFVFLDWAETIPVIQSQNQYFRSVKLMGSGCFVKLVDLKWIIVLVGRLSCSMQEYGAKVECDNHFVNVEIE